MSHKVSPSPYCCSRLELRSHLVLFIYCIHIGLVSRQPSNVWVTRVRLSPTWSLGEFEQVWASIWRLSEEKRRRRRRESFLRVEAEIVRCAESSPLCVWSFGLSAPSLSLLARMMGGKPRVRLDERGISLTKSVSTTKRRLYQIPLIPTQWCHIHHSPALNCRVKKKMPSFVEGTHHFKKKKCCQQA